MSSPHNFSSASAPSSEAAPADSWTHVRYGKAGAWGTTRTPDASTAGTRAFSIASASTTTPPMPPRAPSSRMLHTGPPPPKSVNTWSAARPAGAVAAASAPKTVDIRSMSDFPSLGGPSTPAATRSQTSNTMAWSRTVADRHVEEEVVAPSSTTSRVPSSRLDDIEARLTSASGRVEDPARHRSRLANIGNRCFDDGPTDYTGTEEFDDDGAGSYREDERRADTPTADDGELNAELGVTRRAGDKSDW